MIDKAQDLLNQTLAAQNVQAGSGQDTFNRWADAADIFQKNLRGLPQDVDQVTRAIENLQKSGKPENLEIAAGLELIRAKAQLTRDMLQAVAEQQSKVAFPGGVPTPAARPVSANNADPNAAKLPVRGDGVADAYDRATESITKHTVRMEADRCTLGRGVNTMLQLRNVQ